MLRDRAGQVSEESRAAESGILPSLTIPLSDVARKERLYLLGTSAIGITTIVFTGLILLRWASSQRKGERSGKRSKTRGDSMFGWGKKDKPKKKRNVPDVEIHVPWLLNARHLKNVPGRKTDLKDAEWICQLVEHGLVRPSFVPPKEIRELRNLTRYRKA